MQETDGHCSSGGTDAIPEKHGSRKSGMRMTGQRGRKAKTSKAAVAQLKLGI